MPPAGASPADASPVLVWFRDDLRLADNPALSAAAATGRPVVALFVLDEESAGLRPPGGAARWWIAGSLRALAADLAALGVPLALRRGPAADVVASVIAESGARTLLFNRRYDAAGKAIDGKLARSLGESGIEVRHFQASLLHEPGDVLSKEGGPIRVFSPFWRAALARGEPGHPLPAPARITPADPVPGDDLESWGLEPATPDWAGGLRATWTRGEAGARARLDRFLNEGFAGYADGRDVPGAEHVSRLSPHLRHGEISPRQVWHAAVYAAERGQASRRDLEKFLAELGWREFSYNLLGIAPDLATVNFQRRFDGFPFADDPKLLAAWQRGQTGFPIVDAGMRQLWTTGWMHNRVRMIVASFLIKHLLIDWRRGEEWFWDTLVDADPANNPASWQWVAGSGADAAPFFRVFNPVLQGQKFDPEGHYVRRYVPELAKLPAEVIHAPWDAPPLTLAAGGVRLGIDYPQPVVDHAEARDRALRAFEALRSDAA